MKHKTLRMLQKQSEAAEFYRGPIEAPKPVASAVPPEKKMTKEEKRLATLRDDIEAEVLRWEIEPGWQEHIKKRCFRCGIKIHEPSRKSHAWHYLVYGNACFACNKDITNAIKKPETRKKAHALRMLLLSGKIYAH